MKKNKIIAGSLILTAAIIFFIGVPRGPELVAQANFDSNPKSQVECVNLSSRAANLALVSDNEQTLTRSIPANSSTTVYLSEFPQAKKINASVYQRDTSVPVKCWKVNFRADGEQNLEDSQDLMPTVVADVTGSQQYVLPIASAGQLTNKLVFSNARALPKNFSASVEVFSSSGNKVGAADISNPKAGLNLTQIAGTGAQGYVKVATSSAAQLAVTRIAGGGEVVAVVRVGGVGGGAESRTFKYQGICQSIGSAGLCSFGLPNNNDLTGCNTDQNCRPTTTTTTTTTRPTTTTTRPTTTTTRSTTTTTTTRPTDSTTTTRTNSSTSTTRVVTTTTRQTTSTLPRPDDPNNCADTGHCAGDRYGTDISGNYCASGQNGAVLTFRLCTDGRCEDVPYPPPAACTASRPCGRADTGFYQCISNTPPPPPPTPSIPPPQSQSCKVATDCPDCNITKSFCGKGAGSHQPAAIRAFEKKSVCANKECVCKLKPLQNNNVCKQNGKTKEGRCGIINGVATCLTASQQISPCGNGTCDSDIGETWKNCSNDDCKSSFCPNGICESFGNISERTSCAKDCTTTTSTTTTAPTTTTTQPPTTTTTTTQPPTTTTTSTTTTTAPTTTTTQPPTTTTTLPSCTLDDITNCNCPRAPSCKYNDVGVAEIVRIGPVCNNDGTCGCESYTAAVCSAEAPYCAITSPQLGVGDFVCCAGDNCPYHGFFCGDNYCDETVGENQRTCENDCYCGDGFCEKYEKEEYETSLSSSCAEDCGPSLFSTPTPTATPTTIPQPEATPPPAACKGNDVSNCGPCKDPYCSAENGLSSLWGYKKTCVGTNKKEISKDSDADGTCQCRPYTSEICRKGEGCKIGDNKLPECTLPPPRPAGCRRGDRCESACRDSSQFCVSASADNNNKSSTWKREGICVTTGTGSAHSEFGTCQCKTSQVNECKPEEVCKVRTRYSGQFERLEAECAPREGVFCGDDKCTGGETKGSCPSDCVCGNRVCDKGKGETRENCREDCSCGDGTCAAYHNETSLSCPTDCPTPPESPACIDTGESISQCPDCGPNACIGTSIVQYDKICRQDGICACSANRNIGGNECVGRAPECAIIGGRPVCCNTKTSDFYNPCHRVSPCGDGICQKNETFATCPRDNCPPPPPVCGDGKCEIGESPNDCPKDCLCGNNRCDESEDATSCNKDCAFTCGACEENRGGFSLGDGPRSCQCITIPSLIGGECYSGEKRFLSCAGKMLSKKRCGCNGVNDQCTVKQELEDCSAKLDTCRTRTSINSYRSSTCEQDKNNRGFFNEPHCSSPVEEFCNAGEFCVEGRDGKNAVCAARPCDGDADCITLNSCSDKNLTTYSCLNKTCAKNEREIDCSKATKAKTCDSDNKTIISYTPLATMSCNQVQGGIAECKFDTVKEEACPGVQVCVEGRDGKDAECALPCNGDAGCSTLNSCSDDKNLITYSCLNGTCAKNEREIDCSKATKAKTCDSENPGMIVSYSPAIRSCNQVQGGIAECKFDPPVKGPCPDGGVCVEGRDGASAACAPLSCEGDRDCDILDYCSVDVDSSGKSTEELILHVCDEDRGKCFQAEQRLSCKENGLGLVCGLSDPKFFRRRYTCIAPPPAQ